MPNPGQQSAIDAPIDGILNVVAGAGTGKTSVLVDRYLKLMREDDVAPERILSLTFTLKAAAEMRHRIHKAVGKNMPDSVPSLYGAWIMNFHQFGFRLIKENAPALGINPDVGVMSPTEFKRIKAFLSRRFTDGTIEGFPMDFGGEIPPPRKVDNYFALFFDAAKKARDDMVDVGELRARITKDDHAGYSAWVEAIIAVARAYEDELRARNLIDFSDMITIPARALQTNAGLREQFSHRFDHILVDEFQDTSAAQNELIRTLSGGDFSRVTVVGDDKQSIYRWRDARVENIREFPGKQEHLSVNYRSHQGILDLAHEFICRDEEYASQSDAIRLDADRGESRHPIVVFHPQSDRKRDPDAEAEALAVWVRCLTGGEQAPGMPRLSKEELLQHDEITVLLRSMNENYGRPQIEKAFNHHGIPYALIGGANAAETRSLELLHAWLSLLLPACDPRELMAVLEREPFNAPDASLHALFEPGFHRNRERDWLAPDELERIEGTELRQNLAALREIREEMRRMWVRVGFDEFIDYVVHQSPMLLQLAADEVSPRAIEDLLGEVHEIIGTLESHDDLNLSSFLEHMRVAVDEKSFREEGDIRYPGGRVRIMTMHQSKGLEFPAVAVCGIKRKRSDRDGFFLSRKSGIYFSAKDKEHWKRGYGDAEEKEKEDRMALQEARCLLYVSMTRAKDFLWVSSPEIDHTKAPLFADVVECAEKVDAACVTRTIPALELPAAAASPPASSREALESSLEERAIRRTTLEETRHGGAAPLQLVTWRELEAFARCPLQLRFLTGVSSALGEYDLAEHETDEAPAVEMTGVKLPAGLAPAEYGLFVHEALRAMLAAPEEDISGLLGTLAGQFGYESGRRESVVRAAEKLLVGLRDSELGRAGEDVALEEPFQVRLDRVVLHGIFDRIERGEGWKVIDYKVGTPSPDHAAQVQFYAWALERITGGSAEGIVCYLREDGVTAKQMTTQEGIDAIGEVAKRLDASVQSGVFEATPGDVCATCAWRSVCTFAATPEAVTQE